jgi:hypothetical protein
MKRKHAMRNCNRQINAFQRRSMQLIGSMMAVCAALSFGSRTLFDPKHYSPATHFAIEIIATIPIIGTLMVIAHYLTAETDEYLRSLVVRSILWGFGLVMVSDTLLGSLVQYHSMDLPFGLLNMDIFVVTAIISLRIQLWRNQ